TISRSAVFVTALLLALLSAMLFLLEFQFLFLQLAQIVIQTVEALLPETTILLRPVGNLFERPCLELTGPPLGITPSRNQSCVLQHFEVLRDCGQTHREWLGQLCNRGLSGGQARKDRAPSRIGDGGQSDAQTISCHTVMYLSVN